MFRQSALLDCARAGLRAGLVLAGLLVASGAGAQSPVCRQLETELASLGRTSVQPGRPARAERAQLARVQGAIAAMDCNRGFVLFGSPPPPQCGGLKAQAAGLSARIAQIEAPRQVASGGNERRRMQILAALDSYGCRSGGRAPQVAAAAPPPPRQRGFFETIFGINEPDRPRYATPMPNGGPLPPLVDGVPVDEIDKDKEKARKFVGGGPLAICVRTCDGFFFPVNYEGTGANDQYEEMCQASCPASATEVYWMPAGADLDRAANEAGVNYTALPNAFKYRQAYDATCTCKKPGQTWAQALRQADVLIGERRSDITVTQEDSNRMAQPVVRGLRGAKGAKGQDAQAALVTGAAPAEEKYNPDFATNGKETSGIGQKVRTGSRLVGQNEGELREISGRDGEKKNVRVVAPELAPGQ